MALIKTPYSDQVGPKTVPKTSSGKVTYDTVPAPDLPGRNGGLLKEVTFDTTFGDPKTSGPIKRSPYKDVVK